MREEDFYYSMVCPWCNKGKTVIDKKAPVHIHISVVCVICSHVYTGDLYTGKTYKSKPIRNR